MISDNNASQEPILAAETTIDDNVSQEPILAAETTIAMTPSGRKSMIAQLFEKGSEVEAEVETLEDSSEVQTSMISTESEQTINFDTTTPISVGAMTPASRKTMVAKLTKEDIEAQKSAQSSAEIEPESPEPEIVEPEMETEIIEPESPQPSGYTITKFPESESEAPQASTVSIASENEDQLVTEVFDTTVSVESDSDQGILLRGIDNCNLTNFLVLLTKLLDSFHGSYK